MKTNFNFNLNEETSPSDSIVWNHWTGTRNSGKDAVAQAKDIDKTQLSKGHRKRPKKRTWTIETTWNMLHGVEEYAQLKKNGIQKDTVWLHVLRDNFSVTKTQMCSLQVPTAASWRSWSCNGSAAPFKTMWTPYGSFVNVEILIIIWNLIETQIIRSWGFMVKAL